MVMYLKGRVDELESKFKLEGPAIVEQDRNINACREGMPGVACFQV